MGISASTAKWNDLRAWSALVDGSACPICLAGPPLDVLCALESGWVTMQEAAPVRAATRCRTSTCTSSHGIVGISSKADPSTRELFGNPSTGPMSLVSCESAFSPRSLTVLPNKLNQRCSRRRLVPSWAAAAETRALAGIGFRL